jgi:hypothetical protein
MSILFRDATEAERHGTIRSQWINRVAPRRDGRDTGPHGVTFGRKGNAVSPETATRMVELLVDDRLRSPGVIVTVAELQADGVTPEIIGWAAHEPSAVHFVCVPNGYGRRGIGRELLRRAGGGPCSWSTPNGRALESAVRGKEHAA